MSVEKSGGNGIWDALPEEWATSTSPKDEPQNECHEEPVTPPASDPLPKDDRASKEAPQNDGIIDGPVSVEQTDRKQQDWRSKRRQKKIKTQNDKEFEKKAKENRYNSSQNARKAYEAERTGNRRDFVILGTVLALVVLGMVVLVFFMTGTKNQKIYTLIEEGNFSTAYHTIEEQYEDGKNVDSVVYTFVDSCVEQEEYKRAVAALEMLSEDAVNHADFFEALVENLISRGKTNRAAEVVAFMYERGGTLAEAADELLKDYNGF